MVVVLHYHCCDNSLFWLWMQLGWTIEMDCKPLYNEFMSYSNNSSSMDATTHIKASVEG